MPEEKKITVIRSEEVREIMGQVPHVLIRWGNTIIFLLLLLLISLSYFIKYPDVIEGEASLTTENPPIKLVSPESSRFSEFLLEDKQEVSAGQTIAILRNQLGAKEIELLKETIATVKSARQKSTHFDLPVKGNMVLGEAQEAHNKLLESAAKYKKLLRKEYLQQKRNMLRKKIAYHEELSQVLKLKLAYSEKELERSEELYTANKSLFEQGYIAKKEFFEIQDTYELLLQSIKEDQSNLIRNNLAKLELEEQQMDLTYEYTEQRRALETEIDAAVKMLENYVYKWEETFAIKAPFAGTVIYMAYWAEEQHVNQGDALFALLPKDNTYIGYVTLSEEGYGKIKPGQKARIKVNNYPYQEYGVIEAVVLEKAQMMTEGQYTVKIGLNQGLKTTYNKIIDYQPEMKGTVEILTREYRLIERVFSQFRKIFSL